MTPYQIKTIADIRKRNNDRVARQEQNLKLGYAGYATERRRKKPSPIQDIETLLQIIDQGGILAHDKNKTNKVR